MFLVFIVNKFFSLLERSVVNLLGDFLVVLEMEVGLLVLVVVVDIMFMDIVIFLRI